MTTQQQQQQTTDPIDTLEDGSTVFRAVPSATTITAEEQPKKIVDETVQTPWATYLNSLNGKYQDRIRKAAQASNYSLTMIYEDGREEKHVFIRRKLVQWQFDAIEELRADSTELSNSDKPKLAAKTLARMYSQAATYLLWHAKEDRAMTEDEYKHCVFSEIRPALDASMLLGLITDTK
jgi:hypothetical protein